jgi:hypothetical protein
MKAVSIAASATRHTFGALVEALILVAIVASLVFGIAAVTGKSPSGASSALAAHGARSGYTGSLVATPAQLKAGDVFDVTGCGYDTSLGNVIVGFTGGSWGSALDSAGCFTISGIPALSGDTLPAGTYEVTALQYVRNRWRETGETTVTVVP